MDYNPKRHTFERGIATYLNYMVLDEDNKHNQNLVIENNLGDDEKVYQMEKEIEELSGHVIYKNYAVRKASS